MRNLIFHVISIPNADVINELMDKGVSTYANKSKLERITFKLDSCAFTGVCSSESVSVLCDLANILCLWLACDITFEISLPLSSRLLRLIVSKCRPSANKLVITLYGNRVGLPSHII